MPASRVLVADVGGTHVRFALAGSDGQLVHGRRAECAELPGLAAALASYLGGLPVAERPTRAAVAVASPVTGDEVRLTNLDWSFSIAGVRDELGLERLEVLNDFTALALGVPHLAATDTRILKPGTPRTAAPIAVLGPGTGLGVSILVAAGDGWTALASEGGHGDLAATNEREWQVAQALGRRFGHVSAERALSGPGLVNLHRAVGELRGGTAADLRPEEVVAAATTGDEAAAEAVALFCGWLGAVAGDLALTAGALGGVYLGGGVLPAMGKAFDVARFVARFVDKGRFAGYLEPVPVLLISAPDVALRGAARALAGPPVGAPASGAG